MHWIANDRIDEERDRFASFVTAMPSSNPERRGAAGSAFEISAQHVRRFNVSLPANPGQIDLRPPVKPAK